jgi:predicted nuclease with TOPRIM domain
MNKYDKPIEELRVADFQRDQRMKQYVDQGEAVTKELERVRAQTQGFLEQQQEAKRYFRVLDAFQARQEKQQTEVSEMQRLAEDRLRRQWEEWQQERDKQIKKQEALIEERWRRQETLNDDSRRRFEALPPVLELHQRHLDALWDIRRNDATSMLKAAQNVYDAIVAPVDEQLAALRGDKSVKK